VQACSGRRSDDDGLTITEMVPDRPLSRAGSLPHWICVGYRICDLHRSNVGEPAREGDL